MPENNENKLPLGSIGGQAIIEGIMMRGGDKQAVVVRTPDGLQKKLETITIFAKKYPILGLPIIRGTVNFLDSMINGIKVLTYSADFFPEEEGEPSKLDKWIEEHFEEKKAEKIMIGVALVLGIALAVGLFVLLPTIIAGFFSKLINSSLLRSLL